MRFKSQNEKYAYWVNEAVRQVMYTMRGEAEIERVLAEPAPSLDALVQQADYVDQVRADIQESDTLAREICRNFRRNFAEVQAAALSEMVRRDVRQNASIKENLKNHADNPEP